MPELPEVETVKRNLQDTILNQQISDVVLYSNKSLRNANKKELNNIKGQKIKSIDRKAKHLIIRLEKHYLILHLRMEGKIFFLKNEKGIENEKKSHFIITFKTKKGIIIFKDHRLFATVDIFNNDISYKDNPVLIKVGNETFDTKPDYLYKKLKNKRVAIKTALLDQSIMSGLGNIYVDEVLYSVKIHPQTQSNQISKKQCDLIIKNSNKIMSKSIEVGGTSKTSFTYDGDKEGGYYKFLKAHVQKECKKCKTLITKIKVGGRGTYYCKICQKLY